MVGVEKGLETPCGVSSAMQAKTQKQVNVMSSPKDLCPILYLEQAARSQTGDVLDRHCQCHNRYAQWPRSR
jgi:hypothetical protein